MGFVLHALRPTDTFLDVGANVGSYTVIAAGAVGAHTIAVEPIPATFGRLQMNVKLNGLEGRVRCERIGLSDRVTVLRFTEGLDTVNHVLPDQKESPGIEVPVSTLDEVVGGQVPAIIKIDVEGHELAVLKGADRTLADRRLLAVIMETNGSGARYGIDDSALSRIMSDKGFEPYAYDPFSRRFSQAEQGQTNTLFVRDMEAVQDRVQRARKYALINGSI